MPVVKLFRALGDPNRLEIIKRLSTSLHGKSQHTISSLSKGLNISRQGARKHLRILEDSKLIVLRSSGRKTAVNLNQHTLDAGRRFIVELESQWQQRLESLRDVVEKK